MPEPIQENTQTSPEEAHALVTRVATENPEWYELIMAEIKARMRGENRGSPQASAQRQPGTGGYEGWGKAAKGLLGMFVPGLRHGGPIDPEELTVLGEAGPEAVYRGRAIPLEDLGLQAGPAGRVPPPPPEMLQLEPLGTPAPPPLGDQGGSPSRPAQAELLEILERRPGRPESPWWQHAIMRGAGGFVGAARSTPAGSRMNIPPVNTDPTRVFNPNYEARRENYENELKDKATVAGLEMESEKTGAYTRAQGARESYYDALIQKAKQPSSPWKVTPKGDFIYHAETGERISLSQEVIKQRISDLETAGVDPESERGQAYLLNGKYPEATEHKTLTGEALKVDLIKQALIGEGMDPAEATRQAPIIWKKQRDEAHESAMSGDEASLESTAALTADRRTRAEQAKAKDTVNTLAARVIDESGNDYDNAIGSLTDDAAYDQYYGWMTDEYGPDMRHKVADRVRFLKNQQRKDDNSFWGEDAEVASPASGQPTAKPAGGESLNAFEGGEMTATESEVRAYARSEGISYDEARKTVEAEGYTVVPDRPAGVL